LCVSSRASQQATPNASSATPATRPRGMLAPVISASSSKRTTMAGTAINPSPVAASIMAVNLSKRFMAFGAKGGYFSRLVCGEGDCFYGGLLFLRGYLRRPEFEGQLVNRASEAERQRVAVVHPRTGIDANVESLVNGHHQRNRMLECLAGQFLAVNRKHAGAAFAGAGTVVFEVEDERVLARCERLAKYVARQSQTTLPAESFQIEEVVNEDRLAFEQVEAIAAEPATQRHDHSFS